MTSIKKIDKTTFINNYFIYFSKLLIKKLCTFDKNHDKFESEIQSGIQIIPKNLGFSGKRLDFQAFQKSGLEPVARATN